MAATNSIYVYPFNPEYVKMEGAASADEFRDWVTRFGDSFYYTLANAQTGDILLFAWMEPDEWVVVGDGIIRSNHKHGAEKWCSCAEDTTYPRHILTGGIRLYPRNVSSKGFGFRKGQFAKISPEDYVSIIAKSVSHW